MSLTEHASGWARWGGYALVLAGGLWIITYVAGVADRKRIDPDYFDGSALMWVGMIANEAAQICLGAGLIMLGRQMWTRTKVLVSGGIVLSTISLVTLFIGLALFPSLLQGAMLPRELSAVTTVTLFAGMVLMGIATLHTRALPRIAEWLLLLVGALTVPLDFSGLPAWQCCPQLPCQ